jgi:hypothetical protein
MNTFIGKPCRKCGRTERYLSGNKPCVYCVKENSTRRSTTKRKEWCRLNKEKINSTNRGRYHSLTEEEKVLRNRKQTVSYYGLTLEDYKVILEAQNGVCAICSKVPEGNLHIDHNHTTKEVRGLLCGKCNRAIGLLNDDVSLFSKAITYLNK